MNARNILVLMAAIMTWSLSACTYTFGECWRRGERGEGSEGAGAGFGEGDVISSGASGDFGATPDGEPLECNETEESSEKGPKDSLESPQDPCPAVGDISGDGAIFLSCSDACSSKCPPPGMVSFRHVDFDPSDFPFVTTVSDNGSGRGGGYQVAKANLKFEHRAIPGGIREWYCAFTIGMPLRTAMMGRVDSTRAAILSEEITEDVANLMDYRLPPGIFCTRFAVMAKDAFNSKYQYLGASVTSP